VAAVLISVRYANIVLLTGIAYVFLRRREFWQAYVASATAIVGATAILAFPLFLGIPYGLPPTGSADGPSSRVVARSAADENRTDHRSLASVRLAAERRQAPVNSGGGVDDVSSFNLDFFAPVKMLFTLKRGLFIWTPLTFFGVIGYLLLLRREPRHRTFLTGLGLSAFALLFVHIVWGTFWAAGFSFSQRFLTGLFPVFVIGIAELLSRARVLATWLLLLCVAWSGFLAVHHFYGYDNVSDKDGVDRIIELYRTGEETPERFFQRRVNGPVSRHWQAYFDWLGLYSRSRDG
jgi:hypothetical protein